MKRFLVLIIAAILLTALSLSVPMHAATPVPVGNELASLVNMPQSPIISTGLNSSQAFSNPWSPAGSGKLTAEQIDDVAKLSYGISMIGIGELERTVSAAGDGVWSSGSSGNRLYSGGPKEKGAVSWRTQSDGDGNEMRFNSRGESGKSDSIYRSLLTYNFGKKMSLEAFLFITSTVDPNGCPQAGDIYVSDDGVSWTLVGSYDRLARRLAENDYPSFAESLTDSLNGVNTGGIGFKLGNVSAQYLRLAFTKGSGTSTGDGTYDGFAGADNSSTNINCREIVVFGTEYTTTVTTAPVTTAPLTNDYLILGCISAILLVTIGGIFFNKKLKANS